MSGLEGWILRERDHAAAMMLTSISAVQIVKQRKGRAIVPKPGSVVASPVIASYDPDPDYFFHWYRDSAVVIDALRLLKGELSHAESLFQDFVRFSLGLEELDGPRGDLASAPHGEAIAAQTRVNPDGTPDTTDWPRPQHDGPALRALALLRWGAEDAAGALLRRDLGFVLHHASKPCFDIWEEEKGLHAYTLIVSAAALAQGADWLERHGHKEMAGLCRAEAAKLETMLEDFWMTDRFRSRLVEGGAPEKLLDISVILAANHAKVADPRQMTRHRMTLARLEELFDAEYAINRGRPSSCAPALGRYRGDRYYSGGAYYFSTLAAAEFHYRANDRARGDAFLETVKAFTPGSGDLSEQFDQTSGAQTSARHLAWSYAAFLSAVAARRGS